MSAPFKVVPDRNTLGPIMFRKSSYRLIDKPLSLLPRSSGFREIDTPASVTCSPFVIYGRSSFNREMQRPLPPRSIAKINKCIVHGQSAAIFTKSWMGDATHWAVLPELSLGKDAGNYSQFFKREGDAWTFPSSPRLKPGRRFDRGVLIGSRHSFNYFHFMCDSLVRALIADHEEPETRKWPLVITSGSQQLSQLLWTLFPGREVIVLKPDELVEFKELLIPVSSSFSPDDPSEACRAVVDVKYLPELQYRFIDRNPRVNFSVDKIVFVKRKFYQAPSGEIARTIINQDEVISLMEKYGAKIVCPEDMHLNEQREIFHNADVVVAMAGAALANAVFCRPGTNIVMICQNQVVQPQYFGLVMDELGMNFSVVASEPVAGTSPHPSHLSGKRDFPSTLTVRL